MVKNYSVGPWDRIVIGQHRIRPRIRANTIFQNRDIAGPKLWLDKFAPTAVQVVGARNSAQIDFRSNDLVFTEGMSLCFALCAVWGWDGTEFRHGYLAHVGGRRNPYFQTALANIPVGAWIVVSLGSIRNDALGNGVGQDILDAGHALDNVWIYRRGLASMNSGFGIDKTGIFGETI